MSVTPSFDLQGHRGARGLFPENTLAGFVGALSVGVSSIELDVAVTRDGVPVVVHDPALDPDLTRDADGTWLEGTGPLIVGLTVEELRRFDVGRPRPSGTTARAFPMQEPRDGARVPTLAGVFAATDFAGVRIHAELKTDPRAPGVTVPPVRMAEAMVATAHAAGALGRLTVRSFDWRGLGWLRRSRPEVPLCWLTDAETETDALLWWDRPGPAAFGGSTARAIAAAATEGDRVAWAPLWAPDYAGLRAGQVAEARALGLLVTPWTVNDPADMARLIGWGVTGLCTDRPDLAREVMQAAGLDLPPQH
jgi:glycerophosphoryl diester phosphodiesterase